MQKNTKNNSSLHKQISTSAFLPMSREDMQEKGYKELDILLISGDAYIDHPSFGTALLGRHLEAHGYKVGIIAQPRWEIGQDAQALEDLLVMGRPRLFVGISAGAIDSMLAHYTAFRKKRSDDAYTPGGQAGARPNRAVSVYANLVRRAFPKIPLIAGGIEASLRRISHYDFWTDSLKKSLLPDAKLDLLLYGMGENSILEVAQKLDNKHEFESVGEALKNIRGSARIIKNAEIENYKDAILLPSHDEILKDKKLLVRATLLLERQVHQAKQVAIQSFGDRAILLEKPSQLLSTEELDKLYSLPFTRLPHPRYKERIPAVEMMQTSLTSHRGCGGGCSFCSLAIHQSRHIQSRSKESLFQEIQTLAKMPKFHGHISDIGGPSANMWQAKCSADSSKCTRSSCMFPKICPSFKVDQEEHIWLLREAKEQEKVKSVRVASGIRFDLALKEKSALMAYTGEFTGGQLKVAPEHCVPTVLNAMRKPSMQLFEIFLEAFYAQSKQVHKEQYVVPYLMSAFPNCTEEDMKEMKDWLAQRNWKPQQVQCFIPTPSTVATAYFYAEQDEKGNPIYVAKTDAQRMKQHYLLVDSLPPSRNKKQNREYSKENRNNFENKKSSQKQAFGDKKQDKQKIYRKK